MNIVNDALSHHLPHNTTDFLHSIDEGGMPQLVWMIEHHIDDLAFQGWVHNFDRVQELVAHVLTMCLWRDMAS